MTKISSEKVLLKNVSLEEFKKYLDRNGILKESRFDIFFIPKEGENFDYEINKDNKEISITMAKYKDFGNVVIGGVIEIIDSNPDEDITCEKLYAFKIINGNLKYLKQTDDKCLSSCEIDL